MRSASGTSASSGRNRPSIGKSRKTGPRCALVAVQIASFTAFGTSAPVRTVAACFVTLWTIGT
jgi:hypothetical protein